MTQSAQTAALFDQMPEYGSEFAKTFANHAPMVLTALDRIGGSPERLTAFFETYRDYKSLLPFEAPSGLCLTSDTWQDQIGNRAAEPDLRLFFTQEVARLGIDNAVRLYIDRLAPGVGASAFHALMRLAYGLLRRNDTDVAVALAYWAATYLPMPMPTGRRAHHRRSARPDHPRGGYWFAGPDPDRRVVVAQYARPRGASGFSGRGGLAGHRRHQS